MTFTLPADVRVTVPVFFRACGYTPDRTTQTEQSFVLPLHRERFPRFHVYVTERADGSFSCKLHLDAKAPSYTGSRGHSGEYDSEVVRSEAARIGRWVNHFRQQ